MRATYFFSLLLVPCLWRPQAPRPPLLKGSVEGSVFTLDSEGRSYVPGAKVTLQAPNPLFTETDERGQYSFRELEPGQYVIIASFPGLQAEEEITIAAGVALKVELELKPVSVQTSVTVSESSSDAAAPVATETITQKTIDDAPNVNERFESLLPLVPGVVRGPDGRINMKGARNTQSGALVNSANVTDPATGSPAINLPIDVVSSVQVISDPYDPQYGKLAGAVSSVETKTSNYEEPAFLDPKHNAAAAIPRRQFDGCRIGNPANDLYRSASERQNCYYRIS